MNTIHFTQPYEDQEIPVEAIESTSGSDFLSRIMARVVVDSNGCFIWSGCKTSGGYGSVKFLGKTALVHRLVYELSFGESPAERLVCHKCDVRLCCNPDHLFLGTYTDNIRDAVQKGRTQRGEAHPRAKLVEADVVKIIELRRSGKSYAEIGRIIGVSARAVTKAATGETWRHIGATVLPPHKGIPVGVDRRMSHLVEDDIRSIRSQAASGAKLSALAKHFGVSGCTISTICSRKTWRHVP